ncbi:MAG: TIGR02757 family protein [Bacteroidetes bacterium]|nr:TIGR02757 family protein [Bacteroidota bacterium]HET6243070.1 TIGR02757 family protein [Bacteroidia bacterium]
MKYTQVIDLKGFLEEKYLQYNRSFFIESDPISIPYAFSLKEDIEIASFLSSIIAWGQRKTIINNARKLMEYMGNSPYEFIMDFNEENKSCRQLKNFVHRTFNGTDCIFFVRSLQHIYKHKGGLETIFSIKETDKNVATSIVNARKCFFEIDFPHRSLKHFSNPLAGSAAKRINMFLRWMVRKDRVDFGIWKSIQPSQLICPLDVHTGNVSRKLGLLTRSQNDWKAAEQLTESLLLFDPIDPVKYDFALFGLGVFENF